MMNYKARPFLESASLTLDRGGLFIQAGAFVRNTAQTKPLLGLNITDVYSTVTIIVSAVVWNIQTDSKG